MLTDDLTASLQAHAGDVDQPAPDLLTRVDAAAHRQQRRRIAVISCITLVALVGAGASVTATRHVGRSASTPVATIGSAPCDAPDGVQPSAYLDWPCAEAADGSLGARLDQAAVGIRTFYKGTGPLRMRLLADSRHDGELDRRAMPDDTLVEAWYDGSSRAAVLIDVFGTPASSLYGENAFSAPAGHPAVILGNDEGDPDGKLGERRAFARADVASLLFVRGSVRDTVPVSDGVATLTFPFDGADAQHPDWEVLPRPVPGSTAGGLFLQVAWDSSLSPPAAEPTASPSTTVAATSSAAPVYPSGRDLCEDPAAEGQRTYLDWPCAAPADNQVQMRVDAIIAGLHRSYGSIKTPHVRLLADTLDDGDPAQGPAATEIEVWDTSDPRSAVLATYEQSDSGTYASAMVIYANDPGVVVNGSSKADVGLVFARAGITTLRFRHGAVDEPVAVHGGIGLIHLPSDYSDAASWTVTGYDASGSEVAETAWSVDGCAKAQTSPCNPLATPSARPTG